jgi:hypothetical protein
LAIRQGRLDEAHAQLDTGLAFSRAARSTQYIALCLVAFARLALAENRPDRAALLAGAADGLRERVSLRAWPMLRDGEDELRAQTRQALGTERFNELHAAGARLNQDEAVAVIGEQQGATALMPLCLSSC